MQRQLPDHSLPGCTGAGYHIFAGKEVSRALAKMSLVEEECNGNLDDLTKHQLDVLQDWETKFQEKYEVVGQVTLSTSLLHLRNTRCCCIAIMAPLTKRLWLSCHLAQQQIFANVCTCVQRFLTAP